MNQNQAVRRVLLTGEVAEKLRMHPASLSRLVRQGKFPRPLKVGSARNGWYADEVEAYLERSREVR